MKLILTQTLTTERRNCGNGSILTIFRRIHHLEIDAPTVAFISNSNMIVVNNERIKLSDEIYATDSHTLNALSNRHIRRNDACLEYYQELISAGWIPENQIAAKAHGYPDIPIV